MPRFMLFTVGVLMCCLVGLPMNADDPPKKLTPEERDKLGAKWEELGKVGFKEYQAGRYPAATKALEDALEIARQLYPKEEYPDGHKNLAVSLNNLGNLYWAQGRLAEAEARYQDSLDMNRRLFKGDHPSVATGLNNLALLYLKQGKHTEAEPLFLEALEMRKLLFKGDHPEMASSLNNLGNLYRDQGKLAVAERFSQDALDMYRRLFKGDHPEVATCLSNLGILYWEQRRLAEAERLTTDALDMRRRLFKGDHPGVATVLNNLGILYWEQGRLAEAERLYKDALDMRRRLFKGDHAGVAESLNNLGLLYSDQDRLAEAERLYTDALEMRKRLFEGDHPNVANSIYNLGSLYRDQGKLAEAERLYKDALDMHRRLFKGDHPEVADSLNNLGGLYRLQGKLVEAEALLKEAMEMYTRLIVSYAKQQSEGPALTLSSSKNRPRTALLSLARARGADPTARYNPAVVYPTVWATKGAVTRVFEHRYLAARAAATDPTTAKILVEQANARRRRAELLLAPATKDPGTLDKREEDIAGYEKRIAELDRDLRPLLPAVARADKLNQATVTDLQKVLPADAALVDFIRYTFFEWDNNRPVGEKEKRTARYLAFVVTRNKVAWVDLDTADAIDKAVTAWRESITGGKEIPAATPAKVREFVWDKVRKEIPPGVKTVYISPDAALCRVPWAALPGDKPGTILLEDFALATIPHTPFLLDRLWPQDPLQNPPTAALVVGGVKYDTESTAPPPNPAATRGDPLIKPGAKLGWNFLPDTVGEANGVAAAAVRKTVPVTRIDGERATTPAVLAALPRAKYAHFATHGFFADPSFRGLFQLDEKDFEKSLRGERIGRAVNSPLVMTGLVFAGANNPNTPGRGIVTGEALIDLDLSGLELAVLSACETGLGDVAGGEGTFGLQRAFHMAGTRDVIASLWKVPDQPTAALMALFYQNLWTQNLSPIEALRQAQLEIYRNPGKIPGLAQSFRGTFKEVPGAGGEIAVQPGKDGKAHPLLWAAFTLSGPGR